MKILISGVGIVGPTLAYWLLKEGKGKHEILMIDQSPELRTGGYLIDFWGLGYDVACRMGLKDKMQEVGFRASDVVFVNEEGVQEGGFKTELFEELLDGDFATLLRSELARLIYEKLPLDEAKSYPDFTELDKSKIDVRFGMEVTSLQTELADSGPRVTATFSDGNSDVFDLVVGADGLHSKVRQLAFKDELSRKEPLKDLGMTVAAAALRGSSAPPKSYELCSVPGRTVFIYEMNGDEYMALFIVSEPAVFSSLSTPEQRKEWVLEKFKDMKFRAPGLLDAVSKLPDMYVDTVAQTRLEKWTKPGIVLVGDAAGSPSLLAGEGSGLGIIGAYSLAHALNTVTELETALENYEAKVKPFVTKKQNTAKHLKLVFGAKTWIEIWIRNFISKLFMFKPLARWVLGSIVKDDIELPSY